MTSRRTLLRLTAPETVGGEPWQESAKCRGMDPEEFYVGTSDDTGWSGARSAERVKYLRTICRECPAIQACLAAAIRAQDGHGFRGGMTPPERRKLTRKKATA